MLSSALKKALAASSLYPQLLNVMDYAVFPPGKLFRPRLVEALALDLGGMTPNHYHLASAIELHHAYTLVHDDLPAMDNDDMRRGKPSTHKTFGEWRAILAGDGLLIASFNEVNKVGSKDLTALFAWATGPKGLILGQFLDLSAQGKANLAEVIRIHELKTGRLIQIATLGTYLLSNKKQTLRGKLDYLRLGQEIGVSFQLLDDLTELTEAVTAHEKEINPFLSNPKTAISALVNSVRRLHHLVKKNNLTHLGKMLEDYFTKSQENLKQGQKTLEENIRTASPVVPGADVFDQLEGLIEGLTNF